MQGSKDKGAMLRSKALTPFVEGALIKDVPSCLKQVAAGAREAFCREKPSAIFADGGMTKDAPSEVGCEERRVLDQMFEP